MILSKQNVSLNHQQNFDLEHYKTRKTLLQPLNGPNEHHQIYLTYLLMIYRKSANRLTVLLLKIYYVFRFIKHWHSYAACLKHEKTYCIIIFDERNFILLIILFFYLKNTEYRIIVSFLLFIRLFSIYQFQYHVASFSSFFVLEINASISVL